MEIADDLGWDGARVERLLSVYVDRNTIVRGIAERIQRLEEEARRHHAANPSDSVTKSWPAVRKLALQARASAAPSQAPRL